MPFGCQNVNANLFTTAENVYQEFIMLRFIGKS